MKQRRESIKIKESVRKERIDGSDRIGERKGEKQRECECKLEYERNRRSENESLIMRSA